MCRIPCAPLLILGRVWCRVTTISIISIVSIHQSQHDKVFAVITTEVRFPIIHIFNMIERLFMNKHLVLPAFPSTEYKALYSLARRTIKQAIADNEKLMNHGIFCRPITWDVWLACLVHWKWVLETITLPCWGRYFYCGGDWPFHFQLTPYRYTEQAHAQRNAMFTLVTNNSWAHTLLMMVLSRWPWRSID